MIKIETSAQVSIKAYKSVTKPKTINFLAFTGIQLGGLGAIAPERKEDLARIVVRAFVAGCLTSFLNACVAGSLISTKV